MENNKLKEKIRKNIKEEIAISNIRKEFGMKSGKNKKLIYTISSICAVFILGVGILASTWKLNHNIIPNKITEIGETGNKEDLKVELNINQLKELVATSLDADVQTMEMTGIPENLQFINNIKIPEEYQLESSYNVYIRSERNIAKYDLLHDYVFNYKKDSTNSIIIAVSEVEEPLRDYYIDGGKKVSKIRGTELIISQWKDMYIVTFEYNDLYFDIETTGVTENQLLDLLESLINNITNINQIME